MPQDWAKFLTCRSGNYKKMPEVLALAGCIPIMLGRQGMNPRKSTLVDLVTKKDASGRPAVLIVSYQLAARIGREGGFASA